jgi:hypothetical protein
VLSHSKRKERVLNGARIIQLEEEAKNLTGPPALVAEPEDWKWSSFRHYQTGMRGSVEIESEWTARLRGWELPGWMRSPRTDASTSPVPKGEGPGAPSNGRSLI